MRLVTRSDFDGLVCGTILHKLGVVDDYLFVHPKQLQDNEVEVCCNDVLTNVPYVPNCGLWFDHHSSEGIRCKDANEIKNTFNVDTPSCARLVYDFYDGENKLPELSELVAVADKVDSAQLTLEEILKPTGWVLLGLICDPRTGLGRFKGFRISNYALMQKLLLLCADGDLDKVLNDIDVADRVSTYFEQQELYVSMLRANSVCKDGLLVTDLRGADIIYTGNRFIPFAVYPDTDYSVWVVRGKNDTGYSVAVGRSILKRDLNVDIGSLMLKYGGGGHRNVGTCQSKSESPDLLNSVLSDLNRLCEEERQNGSVQQTL